MDPQLDLSAIAPGASLSQQLGLDSLRLATLFDRIRQDNAGINLLPWFMNAARQGGDSLESLVTFMVKAGEQQQQQQSQQRAP
ncbi:hypothetical protein [Hyalangium gracile]|uniref:hypothetical protein n=1 Tax=Hyalangium gracile TaxID=394092 RepID=UPI001CCF2847|nr:hypothetical protein [Hyalangium gracile]